MSYMKLLKLMYLADRKALLEHGRPITFDGYVSMDRGPVLSQTYNLIVEEDDPDNPTYWRQFISAPIEWEVELRREAPSTELSPAQEQVLDEIFAQFGGMNRWELVRLMHTLTEWSDPHGSSIPIDIDEILRAGGMSEADREGVEEKLAAEEALAQLDF